MKEDRLPGKKYWRSLERLLGNSGPEIIEAEFPEGADEPPTQLERREMLKLLGASMALAGVASCRRPEEAIVPFVSSPPGFIPGKPVYYATSMPLGSSSCGVLVESYDGRPIKVEGNDLHPSSRGAANGWMQASILGLYDPDRLRRVKHLASESGQFEDSSWPEFSEFWSGLSQDLQATQGESLAFLCEQWNSPSLSRLKRDIQDRFPAATWVHWEPFSDASILEACRELTGETSRPVYHFGRARKILSLEADFLHLETEAVRYARDWADSRDVDGTTDSMSRLYVLESSHSTTGACADHRLALSPGQLQQAAVELARLIGLENIRPSGSLPASLQQRLEVIAEDLKASQGEAVVVAGRGLPAWLHSLALQVNAHLGSLNQVVELIPQNDLAWSSPPEFQALNARMQSGEVSTLFILGGNPVYDAPADFQLRESLHSVENVIYLGLEGNETAQNAHWTLPMSHFLESWGDCRSADGTVSPIQPLIAPLHDSRSSLELLALISTGSLEGGYELVRSTWRESFPMPEGSDFERFWKQSLHDGVAPVARPEAAALVESSPAIIPSSASREGMAVTFQPSLNVFDGRFANNAWLQELPDPITKVTWTNLACLSPATAKELNIDDGDVVRLTSRDRSIDVPVMRLPGQADKTISLTAGYGREAGGEVAREKGANIYLIRFSDALYDDTAIQIEPVGKSVTIAQTQEHWTISDRPLIREASLKEFKENPNFAAGQDQSLHAQSLWQEHEFTAPYQWGMVIDLNRCIGCSACVVACQSENNIPVVGPEQVSRGREMHWLRIDRYFSEDPDEPRTSFQPVPCMQCENAPCEQVCPVAATVHDGEGLNSMVYNRCIGTRYCSNNCPYKVRRFNFFNYTRGLPETVKMAMNPDVTVRSRGVMEKCTYCTQRIQEAKLAASAEDRTVRDGEIQTACQQTCPTQAIQFGNLQDESSEVSKWKKSSRNYILLAELYNKPRTSYLARIRNPNPRWEEAVT